MNYNTLIIKEYFLHTLQTTQKTIFHCVLLVIVVSLLFMSILKLDLTT